MSEPTQQLRTVGDVARETGIPVHRVRYAVMAYRIDHARRFGTIRVFNPDGVAQIKAALRRMPASRDIMAAAG